MKIAFFGNPFDNCVEQVHDTDWPELCRLFGNHTVGSDKHSLAFILARFKTREDDFRPAMIKVRDDATGILLGEHPKLDGENRPVIGRLAENLIDIEAIVLDFDGGCPMEQTIEQLSDITHLGYTSHSHGAEGKKGDRYRVIIPFAEPCPIDDWVKRRHEIINMFPGADPSSVANCRLFYAPSCPWQTEAKAFTWNVAGTPFDWRWLEPEAAHVPPPRIAPEIVKTLSKTGDGRPLWETFDMVAFMQERGMIVRQVSATKWDARCPNEHAHSSRGPGGTVVYQDGLDFPSFYCSHTGCSQFNFWRHYKSAEGKDAMAAHCRKAPPTRRQRATATLTKALNGSS